VAEAFATGATLASSEPSGAVSVSVPSKATPNAAGAPIDVVQDNAAGNVAAEAEPDPGQRAERRVELREVKRLRPTSGCIRDGLLLQRRNRGGHFDSGLSMRAPAATAGEGKIRVRAQRNNGDRPRANKPCMNQRGYQKVGLGRRLPLGCVPGSGVGAVGKWPAVATAKSLA